MKKDFTDYYTAIMFFVIGLGFFAALLEVKILSFAFMLLVVIGVVCLVSSVIMAICINILREIKRLKPKDES